MSILRPFLLLTMLLSVVQFGHGQEKDSVIKNIRKLYKRINTDGALKTVKLENEEFLPQITDGGGSLTGYFKGKQLLKIHVWVGLSYGVRQFEYYFDDNGYLCFVYETEEDCPDKNNTGSLDYTKLNLAFEGRYYLDRGVEIEMKTNGKRRFNPPPESVKSLSTDIKSYTNLLTSQLKKNQSLITNFCQPVTVFHNISDE